MAPGASIAHCGRIALRLTRTSALILASALASAAAGAKDLAVGDEQVARLGIRLAEVRDARIEATATVPATVIPPHNGRIAAPVPYAGTVLSVAVLPGQLVKKTDPLVTVASRELIEAISRLRQAEADLHAAEAVSRRYGLLADKDIVARSRSDEAAAQREKALAAVEEMRRATSILGLRINDDGSYTTRAPSDGRVYEVRAAPGGSVEAMAPSVLLDTSDDLWIEAHVPPDLISSVEPGDPVKVAGGPSGAVVSMARALDPGMRSARLLARLDRAGDLVAGQMVTIEIAKRRKATGLEVPSAALCWIEGGFAVFVRTPVGFALHRASVRSRSTDVATIEADHIKAGDRVAVSGLSQLEKMTAGE
jgi:cobalt-zinc-cadmium efflux system membrane fusion protein